jgi:hypothetical protein
MVKGTPRSAFQTNTTNFLIGSIVVIGVLVLAYHGIRSLTCSSSALVGRLDLQAVPDQRRANEVQSFVDNAVETAVHSEGDRHDVFRQLTDEKGPDGGYLIGYQTRSDDNAKAGTLVLHGVPTKTWCDAKHPMCNAIGPSMVGKDLYNFETLGGIYEVRLWIKIAASGGGWAAAFWKDDNGNIKPKYYYIKGVPGKDFLLASGYFM